MKRNPLAILALALCSLMPANAAENTVKYTDATRLTIVNKARPDSPDFQRLDVARYPDLTPIVARYYRQPTGLAIVFRTDSRNLYARWTTTGQTPKVNSPLVSQRGLDLYIRQNGEWVYAGSGNPKIRGSEHEAPLVEHMDGTMHECLLYLPLFDEISRLEIGVDENARLEAAPNPFRHKVVVIGSSITHGTAASRPGMAYPARLNRTLGFEFPNLGASGQCKLDAFYAHIAAETEADAFLFDVFSNPSAQQIEERLEPFVERIRQAHPDTPLIFLQTEVRESGNFDLEKRAYEEAKRQAAAERLERLMKKDKHIHFIDPGMPLGNDHEATVDGVHPTDLGFDRMLNEIQPKISRILKKYGIQ